MSKNSKRVSRWSADTETEPESFDSACKEFQKRAIKMESSEGIKLIDDVNATNFDPKFKDRYWRIENIQLIHNDRIYHQYEDYRQELSQLGRTEESIKDTLLFSVETEKSCKEICQDGYKVGSKKRHILGHTGSGVHLVHHYDILTRYLMFQHYTSPSYVVVFKAVLGKTKPIVPRLHKDENFVFPNAGFDSHVSATPVDKAMNICEALNCSYVYLYEFDDVASNPVKYPRQMLPFAIIQLVKKKVPVIIENPFLAMGSADNISNWEVKGETRRGFRFMFSKSGLKGRHKVFSKDTLNVQIGSYLKGQILEMRTKAIKKTSEQTPPILKRIDDIRKISVLEDVCEVNPPSLQKVHLADQSNSTPEKQFLTAKNAKPVNCVKPSDFKFQYMYAYPQLLQKPLVKLKRLSLKKRTFIRNTASCKQVENNNAETDEDETESRHLDSLDTKKNTPDFLCLSRQENQAQTEGSLNVNTGHGPCTKFHNNQEDEDERMYGVTNSGFEKKFFKQKNIFKPSCIKRHRLDTENVPIRKNGSIGTNGKERKIEKLHKSGVQTTLEYPSVVNIGSSTDKSIRSMDTTFKEIPNDQLRENTDNVSTDRSEPMNEAMITMNFEEHIQKDHAQECVNDEVTSCFNIPRHSIDEPCIDINSSKHNTIYCNHETVVKSKSPIVANTAPDVMNYAPQLSSAQTYQSDKKVNNDLESHKRLVKTARITNKIPVPHIDQPHSPVARVKDLTTVLNTDTGDRKSSIVGKNRLQNNPSDESLSRKETIDEDYIKVKGPNISALQNTMLDLGKCQLVNNENTMSVGSYACFDCKEQINDAMVDLLEEKESLVQTGQENSQDETLNLSQRTCTCKHSIVLKIPSNVDMCDDVGKTAPRYSIEVESKSKAEDKTNTTYNLKIGSKNNHSLLKDVKKDHVKVDSLTASRIRSFLGSTAAAAIKKRQSYNIQASNEEKIDNCVIHNSCKKTNNTLVASELSDMDQAHNEISEYNCPPEPFKERSILSPLKSIQQIDSADDNDSQDTVIGGVALSPVSLHDLHNNVRITDFGDSLLSLKSKKPMSDSFPPVIEHLDTDNSEDKVSPSIQQLGNNDIPIKNMYDLNFIKTEPTELNIEQNNDPSLSLASKMSETTAFPLHVPNTRQKPTKCDLASNASQSKSDIVDKLKELSTVLKYLTDSTGKWKVNAASVAEEMCRTLSSDHADKVNSCSNLVSSSINDKAVTTEPGVQLKQEPLDREYHSDLKLTTASNSGGKKIVPTASKTVYNKITDARTNGSQDSISQFDIEPDRYECTIKPSHENDPLRFTDKSPSEQIVKKDVSINRRSLPNTIWNENLTEIHHEQSRPCSFICEGQSGEQPCLLDPNDEPDILSFETFGNLGHSFDHTFAKQSSEELTIDKHLDCSKNDPMYPVISTPLKPKSCLLTIKSGVLNKGLKFNSLRRQTQTRKLIVRQFPTITCAVNDDKFFKYPALPIKTDKNINHHNVSCDDLSELTDNVDEIKHVNAHDTVPQKLERIEKGSDDEKSTDIIIHQQNTKDDQTNVIDKTINESNDQDKSVSNDMKNEEEIANTNSTTSQSTIKIKDKYKNSRATTVKKKTIDIIPFQTVIRLKKQQYLRYKRGESQKKFIDYRDVFSKYRQRRQHYGIKAVVGKRIGAGRVKNVKMEPYESGKSDNVIHNDHLREQLNYFIPDSKKSSISQRGTALIEDKHCDQTEHLDMQTTNPTESHSDKLQIYTQNKTFKASENDHPQTFERENMKKQDDYRGSSSRSRSRSSHRSHTSGHSYDRKSSQSTLVLSGNRKTSDEYAVKSRKYCRQYHRKHTDNVWFTGHRSHYKGAQYAKSSFSKSGTGYFSWKRKYQQSHINRSRHEPALITGKRDVLQKCGYFEWSKFKQRENLKMKIESAVKEYRNTFEFTTDEQKGDTKVASYLHLLTKKLDKIQRKRDQVGLSNVKSCPSYDRRKKDDNTYKPKIREKLASSRSFRYNVAPKNVPFSRFNDIILNQKYHHRKEMESYNKQHLKGHDNTNTETANREHEHGVNFHNGRREYSKYRPRKHSSKDENRETLKQKRPEISKFRNDHWHKRTHDHSDRYTSTKDWDYKKDNRYLHRNIEYNGIQNHKRHPVSKHEKTRSEKKFEKYDSRDNYHKDQHKYYDKTKGVSSHKYNAWFHNKYNKFSCSYKIKDKCYGIHGGSNIPSRFQSYNHVDDDHFNAPLCSPSIMRQSRYSWNYRGRSTYVRQHDRGRHSDFHKVGSRHTKRDFSPERSSRDRSTSAVRAKSSSMESAKSKRVKDAKTDKKTERPQKISIVCSRRS